MPLLPCPVCSHLALENIERDFACDLPRAVIVARYKVSDEKLQKHLDECLAPPTPESLLAQAVFVNRSALRLLRQALSDNDTKTALGVFDRVDKSLTTIGKLTGAFQEISPVDQRQQTINVNLGSLSVEELRKLAAGA